MIHYQLACASGHRFEGWFAGSAAFDRQRDTRAIACPDCGSTAVDRAPMAPALASVREPAPMPDPLTVLRALRRRVESQCEHVGPRFAEEARLIHDGEAEDRPIYGDATRDEVDALNDDGIEVGAIPWVEIADN